MWLKRCTFKLWKLWIIKWKRQLNSIFSNCNFCFASHGVMEVLRVVFPQYWMMINYDKSFKRHNNVIKAQYYYPKKIVPNQTLVPKVLCFCFGSLDIHMSFFKLTMKNNVTSTMGRPYIVNPRLNFEYPWLLHKRLHTTCQNI